tara:strand:- start:2198 stop:2746 length:549 start_codon:yes stop_codon:yes gene_type:complete
MAINVAGRTTAYKGYEKYSPYSINLRRRALGANLDNNGNVQIYRKAVPTTPTGTTAVVEKGLVINHARGTNNDGDEVIPGGEALHIINDGNSYGILIDGKGKHDTVISVGMRVVMENEGAGKNSALDLSYVEANSAKNYFAWFQETNSTWTTAKNPESDSQAGWLKIMVGSTDYMIPYYAVT